MTITLNGTTGISNDGGYIGDGIIFADTTPANTLVTTTGGNVGIGTSSTSGAKLAVRSGTSAVHTILGNDYGSLYLETASGGPNRITSLNSGLSAGQALAFNGSGGAEWGRFDSSGTLRINNTSTPSGNGGFGNEIAYIGNGNNGSLFYTTASSNSGTAVECTRQNDGAGIYFFRNGSAAGFINITTGAISVNNSSDYRLKENVETLSGSLSKVLQVRPVTFTWKENGAVGKSVIAHELQSVFPDVVFGEKDAVNGDGSIKPQSVALGNLVPDLIVAIQELKAIVDAQGAEIAALKGTSNV